MGVLLPEHISAGADRLGLTPEPFGDSGSYVLRGTIAVVESRAAPNRRTIELNVVVLPSAALRPSLPPLFQLDGGPGRPATTGASWALVDGAGYWRDRDLVLVDQRGTGRSNALICELGLYRTDPFAAEYPPARVAACRDALSQIADLTCYGTADFVADLEEVRQSLGYDRIDLFGFSYGTRVALAYMRSHPESIGAAVLTGALPPRARLRANDAVDSQRGLEALLAECAADEACRLAFPDLRSELEGLLVRLAEDEPVLTGAGGDSITVRAGGLMASVRHLLYSPATARSLPYALHAATRGDWQPLMTLRNPVGGKEEPSEARLAEGVYLSILCSEDLPHFDIEAAREASAATWFGTERLDQALAAAQIWPRADAPAWLREYPDSAQPVLVINGGRDPVTPPALGNELAANLANATAVTIDHMGHFPPGLDGLSHPECFDELVMHFLRERSVDGYPLSRLDEMTPLPFKVS